MQKAFHLYEGPLSNLFKLKEIKKRLMYCWKVIELEPNTSVFPVCARQRSAPCLGTRSALVYFRQTESSSNFILHAETQLDCGSVLDFLSFHCKIIEEGEHVLQQPHFLCSHLIWVSERIHPGKTERLGMIQNSLQPL